MTVVAGEENSGPTTAKERAEARAVAQRRDPREDRVTEPGSEDEAEAIIAISKAFAKLDTHAASRVAEWATACARGESDDFYKRLNLMMIRAVRDFEEAVKTHREVKASPDRADLALYVSFFGADVLTRKELAAYYSDDDSGSADVGPDSASGDTPN